MIAVGETNEYAAEILFFLPQLSSPTEGKTGHVFTLGEVQYKFSGDVSFSDVPLIKLIEVGHGWYAIRLTSAQCAAANHVAYSVACADAQPESGTETIDILGGDIPQNGTGVIPFYLPNETDPVFGAPVTGASWGGGTTTSMLRLRLPDGVFADATVADIIERGNGLYWLKLGTTQTTKRGKAVVFADVAGAQLASTYRMILGAGSLSAGTGGGSSLPLPVESPVSAADPEYVDHTAIAVNRLLQQFKEGINT